MDGVLDDVLARIHRRAADHLGHLGISERRAERRGEGDAGDQDSAARRLNFLMETHSLSPSLGHRVLRARRREGFRRVDVFVSARVDRRARRRGRTDGGQDHANMRWGSSSLALRRRRWAPALAVRSRHAVLLRAAWTMAGLTGEVRVWSDAYAVPHIFAPDAERRRRARSAGCMRASGCFRWRCSAAPARAGSPRCSGPTSSRVDRFIRTLGVPAARANRASRRCRRTTQARLQAYADGVNAWLDAHAGRLPPEFLILGDEPEPWKPVDFAGHRQAARPAAQPQLQDRADARAGRGASSAPTRRPGSFRI